jgi:type I restriction-modification system DNA methylase subunit
MHWIAPTAKDTATATLEKRLWDAADELRANSGLTSAQYSQPVLGLIFLRFADAKFATRRAELEKAASGRRGSRVGDPAAYHASGVIFLPAEARFADLLAYPEGGKDKKTLGQAVDEAMRAVERENPQGLEPFHGRILDPACGSGGMPKTDNANDWGVQRRCPARVDLPVREGIRWDLAPPPVQSRACTRARMPLPCTARSA